MAIKFPEFGDINFRLPQRFEIFLLVVIALLLFLADINLNKVIDISLDHRVTVFGDITILAVSLFWSAIILFHIAVATLVIRAILDRGTHIFYDSIVGVMMLFGVSIVLAGALAHFNGQPVQFFSIMVSFINFYHFGILMIVVGLIYFALTD